MQPPGHDQLTRYLGAPPVVRAGRRCPAPWLPATTGTQKTWSCTTAACAPGRRWDGPRARPAHLAGNGARTAGRPSPGPEGDR